MNVLQERRLATPTSESVPASRRWLRFHTRHLLALIACVAISITLVRAAVDAFGYAHTTVEIIAYHPTWPHSELEYLVVLPNGFSQSGISVPAAAPSIDYALLVGTKYPMRYRARRVLWLGSENPQIVARHLLETELNLFVENSK